MPLCLCLCLCLLGEDEVSTHKKPHQLSVLHSIRKEGKKEGRVVWICGWRATWSELKWKTWIKCCFVRDLLCCVVWVTLERGKRKRRKGRVLHCLQGMCVSVSVFVSYFISDCLSFCLIFVYIPHLFVIMFQACNSNWRFSSGAAATATATAAARVSPMRERERERQWEHSTRHWRSFMEITTSQTSSLPSSNVY